MLHVKRLQTLGILMIRIALSRSTGHPRLPEGWGAAVQR
jgi:hypothetical protein